MNLSHSLRPTPSKYRKIFKEHEVPISYVAPRLNLSYPYTLNLLNGVSRITPEVDTKLQSLVKELEERGDDS